MTVYLELKDWNGKIVYREINPIVEFFRKNPLGCIADWIAERGNPQHSSRNHIADLELISYQVKR